MGRFIDVPAFAGDVGARKMRVTSKRAVAAAFAVGLLVPTLAVHKAEAKSHISVGIGFDFGAPVYVEPAPPIYYAPAPVYAAPPPAYYYPPPVVVSPPPPPVYYAPRYYAPGYYYTPSAYPRRWPADCCEQGDE